MKAARQSAKLNSAKEAFHAGWSNVYLHGLQYEGAAKHP